MSIALLASCSTQGPAPAPPAGPAAVAPPRGGTQREGLPHIGRPYDLDATASLLTIAVYRAGPLARAGHNHVIASHELTGTVYVAPDLQESSCTVRIPVDSLTVDEPQLRASEGADFPPQVPDEARAGTRRNMLSAAVLAAEAFPTIDLTCAGVVALPAANGPRALEARLQTQVRGQTHSITLRLSYELSAERLSADGELPVNQSDLGITPFSAMLGALQVQDQMRVRIHLVARATPLRH
jgi:polyisoprenoid-binding protein YceI